MWKEIEYGNVTKHMYEINEKGDVRFKYTKELLNHTIRKAEQAGREMVMVVLYSEFSKSGVSSQVVARMVYNAFVEPIKRNQAIYFKDNNPLNIAVDNLYVTTSQPHKRRKVVRTSPNGDEVVYNDLLDAVEKNPMVNIETLKHRLAPSSPMAGRMYKHYYWKWKEEK